MVLKNKTSPWAFINKILTTLALYISYTICWLKTIKSVSFHWQHVGIFAPFWYNMFCGIMSPNRKTECSDPYGDMGEKIASGLFFFFPFSFSPFFSFFACPQLKNDDRSRSPNQPGRHSSRHNCLIWRGGRQDERKCCPLEFSTY